ncbi:MAG: hypothetical protein U0572_12680 [Phycisphaerales bacterium]
MSHAPVRSLVIALAVVAPITASSASRADVVQAYYNDQSSYGYKITGMTDLDQKRSDIPNDGKMYCVPTATLNLFTYAANHGFPGVSPGPGNYRTAQKYDDATNAEFVLGLYMGTDPYEGTKGGWGDGAATWAAGSLLATHRYHRTSDYNPAIRKMTKKAVHGAICAFNYGRYQQQNSSGTPQVTRKGGHAVTLSRSYRSGSNRILRYRDPARAPGSDTLYSQSEFANRTTNPVLKTFFMMSSASFSDREELWQYVSDDDGKTYHCLFDGFLTVKPVYGLTFAGSGDSETISLSAVAPVWFDGAVPPSPSYSVPAGHTLLDVAFNMEEEEAIVITKTGTIAQFFHLGRIDLTDGTYAEIPTSIGPEALCTGRMHQIYVHDGAGVYRLDQDGAIVDSNLTLPTPSALAYDDAKDELIVLSVADRKIVRCTEHLVPIATHTPAASIPMSGNGYLTVNPVDSRIWYATDGSNSLRGVIFGTGPFFSLETISLFGLVDPQGLAASDDGELFVISGGLIRALKRDPRGNWGFDPASPFHGKTGSTRIAMLTSRSNLPVGEEEGPEWNNIDITNFAELPPDIADCAGDLDENDVVNAADLAILLGEWGPVTNAFVVADINLDGIVDASDLAMLLGSWGACD